MEHEVGDPSLTLRMTNKKSYDGKSTFQQNK